MSNLAVPADVTVQRDKLEPLGDVLGRGGQANVFALPRFTLRDAPGELVYKEYHQPPSSDVDIRKIVSLRNSLDPDGHRRLDAIATWPCRIVVHGGQTLGVIMPRIPPSFVDTLALPSGTSKRSLREVLNLFAPVERVRRVGRPIPTDEQRLAVCRDFASALWFLHDELSVVFGDLNAKNELWRLDARPMVMFLDCDAVRPRGSVAATKQLNAPDWDPPERGELSQRTDLYKLGLFILRALAPGSQASARRTPDPTSGVLDQTGLDLLTRAVGADPADRPSAWDWTVHLSRLLGDPVDKPALGKATADRSVVPEGHSVAISWTATDALWIEVRAAGAVTRVDGRSGAGVVGLVPDATGQLIMRAGNNYGVEERTIGSVTVVPLPVQRLVDVAMPRLDWDTLGVLQPPELHPPALPVVGQSPMLPDILGLVTASAPDRPPIDWPPLRSTLFPLDVVDLITVDPDIETDLPLRFERKS